MNSKILLMAIGGWFFMTTYADSEAPIQLEKVKINLSDRAALMRGAEFYTKNCMSCHTMKYLQHDSLAKKAGITLDKMPLKEKEWLSGVVPPDLTLAAQRRSPDWLYTYMFSFYKDPTQPSGVNNLLVKNTSMPNIFLAWQGEQVLTAKGAQILAHPGWTKPRYHTVLELVRTGSESPEQYEARISDLVNFLVYAGDPERTFRITIGMGVILFLLIFFVLAVLLKREYWKDVPKNKE